jgi:AraC-like DNA-binding protein
MPVIKQGISKAQLKDIIAGSLKRGNATLPAVASRLQLSRRSLQRRLELLNITHSKLVDEVREEMARSLLAGTALGIAKVGATLGYRDPSSFSRAFMRWVHMSPRDYRASFQPSSSSPAYAGRSSTDSTD